MLWFLFVSFKACSSLASAEWSPYDDSAQTHSRYLGAVGPLRSGWVCAGPLGSFRRQPATARVGVDATRHVRIASGDQFGARHPKHPPDGVHIVVRRCGNGRNRFLPFFSPPSLFLWLTEKSHAMDVRKSSFCDVD